MNAKKTNGEVINIGSGKETNIKEVLQIVINLIGVKKKILIEKRRFRPKKK